MNTAPVRSRLTVLVVGACAAAACAESPTMVKLPSGLRVVSAEGTGDTIGSVLTQPLVVSLADSNGAPLVGRLVRFEGIRVPGNSPGGPDFGQMAVASIGSSDFRQIVYDTTDANGYASIRIKLGLLAGTGNVFIRDPQFGTEDTAKFAVKVGAATALTVDPADSAAYVGQGYSLRATLRDRGGNARAGTPITFNVASGPVTVGASTGALTANTFGRATVIAGSGVLADTAFTSVVPRGVIAGGYFGFPATVDLVQLDGSALQTVTGGPDNGFTSGWGFGWSPDGRDLAIGRGDSVYVISPGTAGRRLLLRGTAVYLGARYSPDGAWIYYAGAQYGMRRVRRDGSAFENVGSAPGYSSYSARPSPSPDGKSVVYINNNSQCPSGEAVKIFDFATGANRLYNGFEHVVCASYAVWSPVGNTIAYANATEIGTINADGTGRRVLSATDRNVSYPEFSPDGRWVLIFQLFGPPLLFDTQSNLRIPVPTLARYSAAAWRP